MPKPGLAVSLLGLLASCPSLAQSLPMPLSKGGRCGVMAPCSRSDDLAGHIRGTFVLSAPTETHEMGIGLQLGLSATLWRWAEVGATFYGGGANPVEQGPPPAQDKRPTQGTDWSMGPLTIW